MFGIYFPTVLEVVVLFLLTYSRLGATAAGIISIGAFTFFSQMLDRVSFGAQRMVNGFGRIYENNLYVGYYFDVLDLPKVIKEKVPGHEFAEIAPPKIQFINVNFGYPDGPKVLKNISFELKPGEHLAIVGPNGAGKTTLTKLLLRFYDPTEGQILVNDYDLRDLKLSHWYKFIGTLFQDFVKFMLTVKDNILLGNSDTIDERKMREAARKSGAAEFIEELPKKYDQRLGRRFEEGIELSHGQWQKLALARAFYEEAPVLILDEPTSAIDAEAEAKIFDNLYKVYKDKSLILISHRFSTVKNADKIIVLQNGRITEEGNHESLMKKDGVYARMFRKQASGYVE
ncbi:MAG: ABC transporter ATP-binding protein [bacterium]|nr:ABC transporter ATP-binding protein [bacterium]